MNKSVSIRRMSFEKIDTHIRKNELDALVRSPTDQEIYRASLRETREKWSSVSDFILHDKFKLPYAIDADSGKYFVPRSEDKMVAQVVCMENDFPYYFERDVLHMVYWKLGSDEVTKEELCLAAEKLRNKYNIEKFTTFINPPNLKSIADISHGHIILKLQPPVRRYIGQTIVIGSGLMAVMLLGKVFHTAYCWKVLLQDAAMLVSHFSLEKWMKFCCDYFVPFPVGFITKFAYDYIRGRCVHRSVA